MFSRCFRRFPQCRGCFRPIPIYRPPPSPSERRESPEQELSLSKTTPVKVSPKLSRSERESEPKSVSSPVNESPSDGQSDQSTAGARENDQSAAPLQSSCPLRTLSTQFCNKTGDIGSESEGMSGEAPPEISDRDPRRIAIDFLEDRPDEDRQIIV